ncbi:MAG: GAF domain-containing protein, partial [Candidatus Hydrogenedentes bacterium]|nr:GAF domain-containing protein [Candidatus Hydrogenedentota bacterium]
DEIWLGSKCRATFQDDTEIEREARKTVVPDSKIVDDLEQIRAKMDAAGKNLTMLGMEARKPSTIKSPPTAKPSRDDLVDMSRAFRRLAALYQASKTIASAFSLEQRLTAVLDTAIEVLEAERGFVVLRDRTDNKLRVRLARQMGQEMKAGSPSMSIAGRAALEGEPVLMVDRDSDSEFGGRESIIRLQIRSAMCVPLKVEDRILGAIYVDTTSSGSAFDEADLELFLSLAAQSAMAIEMARLHEDSVEAEKRRANLGRFLSPAIVDQIMSSDKILELGGDKRTVTTMFCDIRGFTPIAERLTPTLLVEMLNEHFTAMTRIIFSQQGTLDKYIGDEIMAVFGAPLFAQDDSVRAVRAAVQMRDKNIEINALRESENRPTFRMGIGIASGEVIAGYLGSPERMEFTVVGDRVNTARRLCSVAEAGQIVVSEETYNEVKDHVVAKPIGTQKLKGKELPVHAFLIEGMKE